MSDISISKNSVIVSLIIIVSIVGVILFLNRLDQSKKAKEVKSIYSLIEASQELIRIESIVDTFENSMEATAKEINVILGKLEYDLGDINSLNLYVTQKSRHYRFRNKYKKEPGYSILKNVSPASIQIIETLAKVDDKVEKLVELNKPRDDIKVIYVLEHTDTSSIFLMAQKYRY